MPGRRAASSLGEAARAVLLANDLGDYTKPGPRLYPHQWNWDSAFIAVGWAHLDWPRAAREIETLLAGQWTTGMLPHIRYNPTVRGYSPGPEMWPNPRVRRVGAVTSGISQPPVVPSAVYRVGLLQPDLALRMAWWDRLYGPLCDALRYFVGHRTLPGSPLIVVIHPWESGMDNSPRWDFAVRAGHRPSRPYRRIDTTVVEAAHRPTAADYDLYMFLVEEIAAAGYDTRAYLPRAPFAVYDAWFNALWYGAARDLNLVAAALGREPAIAHADLQTFRDAYRRTLWDEAAGLFRDLDVRAGAPIAVDTVAALGGIAGGLVDAPQAAEMLARYRARCRGCRPVPSTPPDQEGFDAARYWRGPVWVNVNWLLLRGLEALGLAREARDLAATTLDLVSAGGMREYFHAYTGEGLGGEDFSWTAALTLDLLSRPV